MMKSAILVFLSLSVIFCIPMLCHADTAQTLPKGISSVSLIYYHYFDITERYDPDGETEDIAADYNADLNGSIFPALSALDPFVGGTATIGRSEVDFTFIYRWWEVAYNYGISDKLTVGILIPYNYTKNKVDAKINNENANVIKNPCFNNNSASCVAAATLPPLPQRIPNDRSAPLIPKAAEAVLAAFGITGDFRLNTQDVQNLLGRGLDLDGDGIPEPELGNFGYKKVETWSDSGVGDIELLAKYQFVNKEDWRLAASGGVRLPTGKVADPDNLVSLPFGDGQTDILFRVYADYIGIDKLLINTTLRYDLQLPDTEEKRVPADVNRPLTDIKDNVDRDLGDIFELEIMGNYSFTREISAGVKYRLTTKMKDRIDGSMKGIDYSPLEKETGLQSHMVFLSLGYSTVQMYMDKKFPIPLSVGISYRNRFAGKNNATKSEFISTSLDVYF